MSDEPYDLPPRRQLSRDPVSPRGVFDDPHPPDGYQRYSVVSDEGQLLVDVLVLDRLASGGLIANLHKLLDRENPKFELRIVG